MATGKVKWFNNAKGYGFILPDGGGDDLFAHYSSIGMDGYKTLKAGQDVVFEVIEGPKGLQATDIQAAQTDDATIDETETIDESPGTSQVLSVTVDDAETGVGDIESEDTGQSGPAEHLEPKASHSS